MGYGTNGGSSSGGTGGTNKVTGTNNNGKVSTGYADQYKKNVKQTANKTKKAKTAVPRGVANGQRTAPVSTPTAEKKTISRKTIRIPVGNSGRTTSPFYTKKT